MKNFWSTLTPLLYLIAFLCFVLKSHQATAQKVPKKSWKKLKNEAEEFEKLGDIGRAALYYESAYAQKNNKKELIYNAGKCYLKNRDYANAVKCLVDVKDLNKDFDKPGYKYALALKQTGQYEEAKKAFNNFITNYNQEDKEAVKDIVDTEIQGCNFALKAQEYTNPNTSIIHLDPNVNTDKTEFAPIPFNNDVLYFSSTVSGLSKIYRTVKRQEGNWMTRQVPTILVGKIEKPHFGNGSFTPEGKRFFFTQCDLIEGGKPQCAIYLMKKNEADGKWSAPIKLPDYINPEGANTTHPCVTIIGDKEILYFASDREGGKGGLDLWYCTRDRNSDSDEFLLPKNLGHNINTKGDEISPHYHVNSQTLYFSSNGRISAGGFDVFKSVGAKMKWEVAQNLGFPINSAADDLYLVVSEAHGGGYFVSNRTYDPNKVSTTNDDIFYYGQEKVQLLVQGNITAATHKEPLEDIGIKLFKIVDGMEELVQDRMLAVGNYKFILEVGQRYIIEVRAEGYELASLPIETEGITKQETRIYDISLEHSKKKVDVDPMYVVVPPEYNNTDHVYKLPNTPPLDPETGIPYAAGTAVYEAFLMAQKTAKESPNREVYWNDKVLTSHVNVAVAKIDPRFYIVPEAYASVDNGYTLPNTVPTNPETGKAFAEGSEGYNLYKKAQKIAAASDEGKVYWAEKELKAVPTVTKEKLDPRYVVVPAEYNTQDNAYILPQKPPVDPTTGVHYGPGSEVYDAFIKSNEVAKQSPDRAVYWSGEELIPNKEIVEANSGIFKHYDPTPLAPKGVAYKIQVSAVRKYRAYKYTALEEGPLKDYKLDFEAIDGGITRVIIIPKEANEDGSIGFKSKSDALNILSYILDHTRFKTAFVGQYENGERVGEGFRGMEEDK